MLNQYACRAEYAVVVEYSVAQVSDHSPDWLVMTRYFQSWYTLIRPAIYSTTAESPLAWLNVRWTVRGFLLAGPTAINSW